MAWQPGRLVGRELAGEFPLTPHQAMLADAIEHTSGHGKHAARSAVYHLGKAWRIKDLDAEMALFRGLTAEEEATTAVLRSLKRIGYARAELLNEKNHKHKAAMHLFLPAIFGAMRETGFLEAMRPVLDFPGGDVKNPPRLRLRSPVPLGGEYRWFQPQSPLHISFFDQSGPYDFSQELSVIEASISHHSLKECIEAKANRRNELLYAWEQGVPVVEPGTAEEHLDDNAKFVFRVLWVFVLVDRFDTCQLAVQSCLNAFLGIVAKADRRVRDELKTLL